MKKPRLKDRILLIVFYVLLMIAVGIGTLVNKLKQLKFTHR